MWHLILVSTLTIWRCAAKRFSILAVLAYLATDVLTKYLVFFLNKRVFGILRQLSTLAAFAAKRRRLPSVDICCPRGAQQQTRHTPLLLPIDGTDRRIDPQLFHILCRQREYRIGLTNIARDNRCVIKIGVNCLAVDLLHQALPVVRRTTQACVSVRVAGSRPAPWPRAPLACWGRLTGTCPVHTP